jgi:hypothetical protein
MKILGTLIESTFQEKEAQMLWGFKLDEPNNYRSIRYADVLLMAAEALIEVIDLKPEDT